jgi:predicted nucleotidyltransferase
VEPTPHAEVNALLSTLQADINEVLSDKLVGLYLYGSLITGEFDLDLSDIDIAAVVAADLDEADLARLEQMHAAIAKTNPRWDDRIEVGYISVALLRAFDPRGTIAVISPGEPFHLRAAESSWLFNLQVVREQGVTLCGAPPRTLIAPITPDDRNAALRGAMRMWQAWLPDAEPVMRAKAQAYVVLTMCRALYAHAHGAFVSKRQAAVWAAAAFPVWSSTIRDALAWYEAKQEPDVDLAATRATMLRFARFTTELIAEGDHAVTEVQEDHRA